MPTQSRGHGTFGNCPYSGSNCAGSGDLVGSRVEFSRSLRRSVHDWNGACLFLAGARLSAAGSPQLRDVSMASQKLQCLCGHRWERPNPGPVPEDIRNICPVCTPSIQAASNPTVSGPDPVAADLKPGEDLAGFEIIKPLNRGGMGVVYKARQKDLNRLAALKVVAPERLGGADHAEYLERFRREVRAAALLNHPNIVTVYA